MEHKKIPYELILNSYKKTNSVWKTGKEVGLCGQSVHYHLERHGDIVSKTWSDSDCERLREYYNQTPNNIFRIKNIASELNKTENAITLKAGELGLTDAHRKRTDETRIKMSESQKIYGAKPGVREKRSWQSREAIKKHGHPKGFLGHHHNEKGKQAISNSSKRTWANPSSYFNSKEYRKILSNRFAGQKHETSYSRSISGRRIDLDNRYFRSAWEANYARYLNLLIKYGEIVGWEYEPDTFWFYKIQRGVRTYLPDFKVIEKSGRIVYHEVKGWLDCRSKTKLKRMAKYYPDVIIELIDSKRYRDIERRSKPLIPEWECRKS